MRSGSGSPPDRKRPAEAQYATNARCFVLFPAGGDADATRRAEFPDTLSTDC
jgi:hypothetical protein